MFFCPGFGERLNTEAMSTFLATEVFGCSGFSNLLQARYNQMGRLFRDTPYNDFRWNLDPDCGNRADAAKPDARLIVPRDRLQNAPRNVTELFCHDNFGHDMPVWVTYNNDPNVRRVMIVSQDPLRTNDESGYLYLSTPFGVHSRDFEEEGHMDPRIEMILTAFLDEGFCVYLTDGLKFYATERRREKEIKIIQEYVRRNENGYRGLFSTVMDWEIEHFVPHLIITMGVMVRGSEWTQSRLSIVQHPRYGYAPKRPFDGTQAFRECNVMTLVHPSRADIWVRKWKLAGNAQDYFDGATRIAIECLNRPRS